MTEALVKDTLDLHGRLMSRRGTWDTHWQEIAERMRPSRADFTTTRTPGDRRTAEIFDSTAMQAARSLAAAVHGMVKAETDDWFSPRAADADLNEEKAVKLWLEEVERRMRMAFYSERARFIQRTGEVDLDLVTFGTGVLFVGEQVGKRELLFLSVPLKDVALDENADGEVDTISRTIRWTARQAAQKVGPERLSPKLQEILRQDNKRDEEVAFVHQVRPRRDRDPFRADKGNMPWLSVLVEKDTEHLVEEDGFREFPYATPRWETSSGEIYGRSPGTIALPDVKTVNEIARTLLSAGQKAVDPPLLLPDEGLIGAVNTMPGGLTYLDQDRFALSGGRPPIVPLDMGKNIPLGREMLEQYRLMIWDAFFRNVLQLPQAGPQMTATEVIQRLREFVRAAGPVFGRLKADYVGRIVPRAFNVMERAGGFPPRPPLLEGQLITFSYQTSVDRAEEQMKLLAPQQTADAIGTFVASNPDLLDNFDADQIARDVAEGSGMQARWLRSTEERDRLRQERAAEQAQAAQLQQGMEMAKVAPGAANALGSLDGIAGGTGGLGALEGLIEEAVAAGSGPEVQ